MTVQHTRRRKRRRDRFLRRRRFFLFIMVVLLTLSSSFFILMNRANTRVQQSSAIPATSPEVVDILEDPAAFFAQERAKGVAEAEASLRILTFIVPGSFVLITLICVWRTVVNSTPAWSRESHLSGEQQARYRAYREKLRH